MKIKVEIKSLGSNTNPRQKASADIILNDCFAIRRVKLIENGGTIFAAMPSLKDSRGRWNKTCHPITPDFNDLLLAAYMEAYRDYLNARGLVEQ